MSDTIEFKDMGLKNLIKMMKGPLPMAKVGILGDKTKRSDGALSNAEIGAKHEFGDDGMPVRSFLRIPISENLQSYLDKSGALDKTVFEKAIKSGNFEEFIGKVGVVAETIVLDAFDSRGFGRWKESNMKFKKVKQTLVETQQLRNSITSEVTS